MNLHHFYHVYADGNWREIVENHLYALKNYGLYDNLDSFNVGVVGSEENVATFTAFLSECDYKFKIVATNSDGWEQVTINKLWETANSVDDSYFVYAHTKGAAHPHGVSFNWRNGMTRHLIVEWQKCVDFLNYGYSTVGCHLQPGREDQPHPFWGGNFWWATSEHIRSLGKCPENSRYDAEAWIGYCHLTSVYKPYDVFPVPIGTEPETY